LNVSIPWTNHISNINQIHMYLIIIFWIFYHFSSFKKILPPYMSPMRESISRPIAPISLVADGDENTPQGRVIFNNYYLLFSGQKLIDPFDIFSKKR
jgi:hypothetical protein